MQQNISVGTSFPSLSVRGIAYHFDRTVCIDELPQFASKPELLEKFKETGHRFIAQSDLSLSEQAVMSAQKTIEKAGIAITDIDAVVIGTSELRSWSKEPEDISTEILQGLGLKDILVVGVTLGGCANYASSLRVARGLLAAEGLRNVLVVETNQVRGTLERVVTLPTGVPAYILGDVAMSYIASPDTGDFAVLGMRQLSSPVRPDLYETPAKVISNMASYRRVVADALSQANITREQLTGIFFHNVNLILMFGLANTLEFPIYSVWMKNLRRVGHLWGSDNFISLSDYCSANTPPLDALFLLICQGESYFSAVVCQKKGSVAIRGES